jgi:hypothetical protein
VTLRGQPLLHVGVEQAHLGLGEASQAVAELPDNAQQRGLVTPEALQRRDGQRQELVVVGSEGLTRLGPGQLPGVEEACGQVGGSPVAAAACSGVAVSWAVGSGNTTLAQSRL